MKRKATEIDSKCRYHFYCAVKYGRFNAQESYSRLDILLQPTWPGDSDISKKMVKIQSIKLLAPCHWGMLKGCTYVLKYLVGTSEFQATGGWQINFHSEDLQILGALYKMQSPGRSGGRDSWTSPKISLWHQMFLFPQKVNKSPLIWKFKAETKLESCTGYTSE